jgi:drug/metabolite transporter (DMT)-like permease
MLTRVLPSAAVICASLFALLASFCWGSSTVLGKAALKQIPFELMTCIRLIVTGTVALLIITSSGNISNIYSLSIENYKTIIVIVFTSGSIALSIYYYGLQNLAASHTTIYELVWPLSAVLIDWLIQGKTLSFTQVIGAIILVSSITILTKENSSE